MSFLERFGLNSKFNFDDLYNTFLGLEKEQQTIVGGALVAVVVLILLVPIFFVSSQLGKMEAKYKTVSGKAAQFYDLMDEYNRITKSAQSGKTSAAALGSDPLKQVVYQITDELKVDRKRVNLKTVAPVSSALYTELAKDVTIGNITFEDTVQLFSKILHYEGVQLRVKKAVIEVDSKNRQVMKNVSFTISMAKPN